MWRWTGSWSTLARTVQRQQGMGLCGFGAFPLGAARRRSCSFSQVTTSLVQWLIVHALNAGNWNFPLQSFSHRHWNLSHLIYKEVRMPLEITLLEENKKRIKKEIVISEEMMLEKEARWSLNREFIWRPDVLCKGRNLLCKHPFQSLPLIFIFSPHSSHPYPQ